ncbi:hypothetical protein [Nocardioides sp.]|uniref:hypothetical protein n=1 Tax=Nocardioides sp. TaxID=35761 RepID=UPI002F3EDCAF
MTTHRDLAEADAFHRHRLVTAFLSGAGTGSRVQPPRAGRCLVGGLVLAAVLVAGSAASNAVTGHPSIRCTHDWCRISR